MGGVTDFLLELRSEEIPARMQAAARAELEKLFVARLAEAGVTADDVTVYSTPRRLALIARDLLDRTDPSREERKGPRADAPDKAIEGFLRSTGLTRGDLEERDTKKGAVLFAVTETPGRDMADVLAEAIPGIVRDFSWPKSMRWGPASASSESLRWVRPLSGIVALLGDRVVDCEVGGVRSGRETMGHRFHGDSAISIPAVGDYVTLMEQAHVLVDQDRRAAIIREGAGQTTADMGLELVADAPLVVENAGLTEWPVPMVGSFDESYLDLPPEVIQLTARVNQKYFVAERGNGTLAPVFVCTANIDAADGGEAIVAGNEKVLSARLSDAQFFWEQDRKTSLEDHATALDSIVFHAKLGTVADKARRVAALAKWLVLEGIVETADPDHAELAARLAKADLVTEMVGEFPELQGVMGGYYARAEGLPDAVADAIRDHYKPVGQGDDVPTAPVTVAVALADKLDTLIGFFAIGEAPTGSKDPFALRRAALAVIALVVDNRVRLSLRELIAHHVAAFDLDPQNTPLAFILDRIAVQQRDAGVRHDVVAAVAGAGDQDDILALLRRVRAVQRLIEGEAGDDLLAAYKRAANILKSADSADLKAPAAPDQPIPQTGEEDPMVLVDEPAVAQGAVTTSETGTAPQGVETHDIALMGALGTAEQLTEQALRTEDYAAAMDALGALREPVDAFFNHVMVNSDDDAIRRFRLGLLGRVVVAMEQVADFSRIEG